MKILSDFSGGNIKLLSVDGNTVNVEQDLKGTAGWWFYWCFRVDNPPADEIIFKFHNKNVVCPNGPATSADGINWEWHKDGFIDHTSFRYTFKEGEKSRYFCFTIPYTLESFNRFFETLKNVNRLCLTKSEGGLDIPLITFGGGEKDVFITARHHCCESPASFVLEGIINASLKIPYLSDNFRFHILPFADIDGVQKGEQGKDRAPHDHNRDYMDAPIYVFTRALKEYALSKHPVFYIDLHSPWKWGGDDDLPHIFLSAKTPPHPDMQYDFAETLKELSKNNTVRFLGRTNPHTPEKCFSAKYFFKNDCKASLSITIETPYSGKDGYTVNDFREWGETIADTLTSISKKYDLI